MNGWLTVFKRMAILVFLASLAAVGVNALRPGGIPLVGQWDTSVGVVSADVSTDEISKTIQTVEEAEALWKSGVLFLDARAAESFAEGRIKGARGFSVYDFDALFFDFLDAVSLETPLVTYCSGRLCDESHQLAKLLEEAGYTNIRVFADGYPAWVEAGLSISSGDVSGEDAP